jgi:hypothetical protein
LSSTEEKIQFLVLCVVFLFCFSSSKLIFHVQSINYVPHQAIKINVRKNRIWIDFGNFGHARHRKKKNKTKTQHTKLKIEFYIINGLNMEYQFSLSDYPI